jgi:hypothetical protein
MITNVWVDLDSTFEFGYEYECEYLTWINLVPVNINDLLIPIIDRWPLNTIQHRRTNIFGRYLTIYISSGRGKFHPVSSNCIKLYQTARHEWSWWKWNQIRSNRKFIVSIFFSSKIKVDRFQLNFLSYIHLFCWFWFGQSQFIHLTSFERIAKNQWITNRSIHQSMHQSITQSTGIEIWFKRLNCDWQKQNNQKDERWKMKDDKLQIIEFQSIKFDCRYSLKQ